MKQVVKCIALLFGAAILPALAAPATFGFACTPNEIAVVANAANCATVGSQLRFEVDSVGSQVSFKFLNLGPNASSITDLYWGDPGAPAAAVNLSSIAGFTPSAGVSFSKGASPKNPGGGITWKATAGLTADSDSPVAPNGINPGESLIVLFNLQPGKALSDVLDGIAGGTLKIAIHVQAFSDGQSTWATNTTTRIGEIPEPGFYGALALGLSGLFLAVRKRRSN